MVLSKSKTAGFAVVLCVVLLFSPANASESKTVGAFSDIYIMVHENGKDPNTIFIITEEEVVVIDANVALAETGKILAEIRKHTDLPIRFAINTYYHGDNTSANQVFKESDIIIAHHHVREAIIEKRRWDEKSNFRKFGVSSKALVPLLLPHLVYEEKMELRVGSHHLQLIHFGRGHTAIVLLELRVLIAGALVVNEGIPIMQYSTIDEWIDRLTVMEDLSVETVIPGHGDVGNKTAILRMKHYLLDLRAHVLKQIKEKKILPQILETVRPLIQKKYKRWAHHERIDDHIKKAYEEYAPK